MSISEIKSKARSYGNARENMGKLGKRNSIWPNIFPLLIDYFLECEICAPKLSHFIYYKIPSVVRHAIILPTTKKDNLPQLNNGVPSVLRRVLI